ncbi:polypeptide deformylase [Azorhizobium caulinodans ORS 571]|uniref:Peptide deformylase-like n=1 Tax=Azorhizobium caulinodans (strain ATCC 43989 / DSM 5975 / JCM 20966 / LMG 6465 / NBRC 14845 / NCIMB 13405 / ORS 571) TaxID=438753 RepID=A8IGM4_AZOC5|nr:peptide deformylase [Azorhizobium caulinodans]BAF86106.1 polypeptide deformylase [Azorhizobium caulinodans ORS 571]
MAVLDLVRFPDPRLRQPAEPVTVFDGALADRAQDLLDTMRAAPGIGITGPHAGLMIRLVALELPETAPAFYVNPRVLRASPEMGRHPEGSVSMPGVVEEVERPARVRVAFQGLDGTGHEVEADGLLSVCLQHEIDQLDGIFWIQRLSRLKRERVVKKYEKLLKAG